MGIAIKHPVPDRVKPSFVIFDIRTLTLNPKCQSAGCQKLQMPALLGMLYSNSGRQRINDTKSTASVIVEMLPTVTAQSDKYSKVVLMGFDIRTILN